MASQTAGFIRPMTAGVTHHRDGTRTEEIAPVWTLAHKGYSGSGRLDVWVYPSKAAAFRAGADLAMQAGLDEDDQAVALFAAGKYQKVVERYEQTHPETHLLRVQLAFLIDG